MEVYLSFSHTNTHWRHPSVVCSRSELSVVTTDCQLRSLDWYDWQLLHMYMLFFQPTGQAGMWQVLWYFWHSPFHLFLSILGFSLLFRFIHPLLSFHSAFPHHLIHFLFAISLLNSFPLIPCLSLSPFPIVVSSPFYLSPPIFKLMNTPTVTSGQVWEARFLKVHYLDNAKATPPTRPEEYHDGFLNFLRPLGSFSAISLCHRVVVTKLLATRIFPVYDTSWVAAISI